MISVKYAVALLMRHALYKFEAEGAEGHSSSIIDLFDNLKSPIDFVLDLGWPDKYQEARFFTSLSKVGFTRNFPRMTELLPFLRLSVS